MITSKAAFADRHFFLEDEETRKKVEAQES